VKSSTRAIGRPLAVFFLGRVALNTAWRIVYPFLPAIARGLGISVAAASKLVALRTLPGLAAPWLGALGDQHGRRRMIEPALLIFSLAGFLLAGFGTLWAIVVSFLAYGLSKILFDPSLQAFLGDSVLYSERGRAVGILELSWSGAWLLGVPATGYMIQHWGWRSPWAVLGVAGLGCLALTHWALPRDRRPPSDGQLDRRAAPTGRSWRAMLRRPGVPPMLVVGVLLTFAIELPFIVYGAWLEQAFGLSLTGLGLASIAIGVAEATAELGSTVLTDRIGKRRSVLAGLLGLAGTLALLPWLAGLGLASAMAGMVLVVLSFEFAIVSVIPLATELVPEARGSFLSLNVTAMVLGRMLGSIAGGWLWQRQIGGITLQAYAGAGLSLAALLVMGFGVREIQVSSET
jgi:predicted MFS family arabinose efflux permease